MLNNTLIAEHDSWLSLDLVVGCPNNCGYCYLRNCGLTGVETQKKSISDNDIKEQIIIAINNSPSDIPISIGNATDMLISEENRNIFYKIAGIISDVDQQRSIVVVTKAKITETIAQKVAEATGGRGIMILSQSFASDHDSMIEWGNVSTSSETYKSFEVIAKTDGLRAVHFWRPFLIRWNSKADISKRLKNLMSSGCSSSIVIGLKGNEQLISSYSKELKIWAEPELNLNDAPRDEWVLDNRFIDLLHLAKDIGYPVFRQTSCAIAYTQCFPDINGTYFSNIKKTHCKDVNCPQSQRKICGNDPMITMTKEQVMNHIELYAKGVKVNIENNKIFIKDKINEYDYNHLVHILHQKPAVSKINMQKAWRGSLICSEVKNDRF